MIDRRRGRRLVAALLTLAGLLTGCLGTTDTTAPTVALTSDANVVTTAGPLTLSANASDDVGVALVAFYRRPGAAVRAQQDDLGTKIGEVAEPPFDLTVDLAEADNGEIVFTAVARDAAGNEGSDAITVPVAITPNRAPIITTPPDQTVIRNTAATNGVSVTFAVADADPGDTLTVTAVSDDQAVVADADLTPDCVAGACTLAFTPDPSADALVTITLTVDDGAAETSTTFEVEVTSRLVRNTTDAGDGSLRATLADADPGDVVGFDPSAFPTGQGPVTITLTTGELTLTRDVTIEGTGLEDLTISGSNIGRVFHVAPGATVRVSQLTATDGFGLEQGGGILNRGALTLERVVVAGNVVVATTDDFWKGGGGIYNDEGGTLNLIDSAVADNDSGVAGGGIFSYYDTATSLVRSAIHGNTADDLGGGLRLLGDAEIVNSTISGNEALSFHGGALFLTDGAATLLNSTVADNPSPENTALFVGTFGAADATLTLHNTIVDNTINCFAGSFGGGTVTVASLGHNVATDASCNLSASGDQPSTDPLLAPLADNGGPTPTHALSPGSPAIEAADSAAAPPTDQRGVARPQGEGDDVGAYEVVP